MTEYLKNTIDAEIKGLQNLKEFSLDPILKSCQNILACESRIIFVGVGKSAIVAQKCNATFNSLGIKSAFLHGSDAMHGDFGMVSLQDIIFAFSFSGETEDILKIARHSKKNGLKIICVTGREESNLAKISDTVIKIKITDEGSIHNLAPMASVISMIAVGDAVANCIASTKNFTKQDFASYHPGGSLGLKLTPISELVKKRGLPLVGLAKDLVTVLKTIDTHSMGITGVINDKRELVGVITDGDIRRAILKHNFNNLNSKMLMSSNPKKISIESNAYDALVLMERYKITALFVIDNDDIPIGIIHIHDIINQNQ